MFTQEPDKNLKYKSILKNIIHKEIQNVIYNKKDLFYPCKYGEFDIRKKVVNDTYVGVATSFHFYDYGIRTKKDISLIRKGLLSHKIFKNVKIKNVNDNSVYLYNKNDQYQYIRIDFTLDKKRYDTLVKKYDSLILTKKQAIAEQKFIAKIFEKYKNNKYSVIIINTKDLNKVKKYMIK